MSGSNSSVKKTHASVFELNGVPSFGQALPLALQHVVAMIVGCVTPSIIVARLIHPSLKQLKPPLLFFDLDIDETKP